MTELERSCLVSFVFDPVPDLETIKFKVLSRTDQYEIREVEVLTSIVETLYHDSCCVLFDWSVTLYSSAPQTCV